MIVEIKIPDSVQLPELSEVHMFLQCMVNRLVVGGLRYGRPVRKQKYMRRMRLELKAYIKEGNYEQLLNLCNYAYLESLAPENKNFHFNPEAASVTREAMGGNIA